MPGTTKSTVQESPTTFRSILENFFHENRNMTEMRFLFLNASHAFNLESSKLKKCPGFWMEVVGVLEQGIVFGIQIPQK